MFQLLFVIILLSNVTSFYGMKSLVEQKKDHIELDWEYGKRERRKYYCFTNNNDRLYPYFPREDYYDCIKPTLVSDQSIMREYERVFNENCDIISLTDENKKALCYVLQAVKDPQCLSFRIEGKDKEFAQKMLQRVLNLPEEIRKNITCKYGVNMMCNTYYEPSSLNVLWDDEGNKKIYAWRAATCGSLCWYVLCNCCYNMRFSEYAYPSGHFFYLSLGISLGWGIWFYKALIDGFKEKPEKRDQRQGFEAISLLTEMECEIVNNF